MDVEQLHIVLQQSFSADASLRKPAEETIRNLKNLPAAVQLLLQVAAEKQVRFEVRQAAAIQLKNICRECWAQRTHYAPYEDVPAKQAILSDADKAAVKTGLIHALLDEPEKSVRGLFAETLHTVVIHEFPDNWPQLVPQLLTTIQTGLADIEQHGLRVHNALVALRKVCKRYEFKPRDQRGPLNQIVSASFPLLLPLAQQLSAENQHSLEAAVMLKQILKIFWSSTQFFLPGSSVETNNGVSITHAVSLSNPEYLQPWFDILTKALKKPLPEDSTGQEPRGQPLDIDARNAWPWWKVKKWAVQIMSRWFSRYGIPAHASDDEPEAQRFAVYFSNDIAPQFMGPVFDTLNLRPTGQFCTDRVLHLCLTFVDLAVELASTYKLLKPHLEFLLFQVCFPTMCLSQNDVDCFENDPVEFVHKQNSPLADFYDPRMSAITLVTDLVRHRGQDVTQNLLSKMTEILHRYNASSPEHKNHIEKDGALLTFGSLSRLLMAKPKYASEIEGLLVSSVFPDFNSPVSFLRFRACWMIQQFNMVTFTDDGTNLRKLIELVLNRLKDPALPVQIEASKALRFLVEMDGAEETLLPVLPQILTEYFRIMDEIGNDEVVSALQVLLDRFGEHIEPHAIALVTQLTNTFQQYCTAGEDEDDDDAALAAAQCLECVATVLKGVCTNEHILKSLEPILVPLVLKILGNDGDFLEYLECAFDILTFLTYFQEALSPELWQAFPLVYNAFDQWAYDYLNMMVPCLLNYIQKGTDVFLSGGYQLAEGYMSYIDMVISMASKTLANDSANETECRFALSLFMGVLNNCHGRIDQYIPFINEIVLAKLGQQVNEESVLTRTSIYQVIGSALYYQPALELVELEKRGVTQQVLAKWIADMAKIERGLTRKMTVLGLASILTIPASTLPQSVTSYLPQLLHVAATTALKIKEDGAKGENQSNDGIDDAKELADDDDDDLGDLDQGFDENEDVTNEVDEAYRKALHRVGDWNEDMTNFFLGEFDDDGEDVDEDYSSPLDQVEELCFLNDALKHAFQREPEAYQQVQAVLPPESVQACQKLFEYADQMRLHSQQVVQQS